MNVAYVALDDNMEDSIIFSDVAAAKLTSPLVKPVEIMINDNDIPINLYGNDKIYKMQYTLPNGTIVDCALFAPEPLGLVGIDSKFHKSIMWKHVKGHEDNYYNNKCDELAVEASHRI